MTCSLVIAAVLAVAVHRRRRDTVVLAVLGALAMVAGQGYMQFTLLAWAPALLFLARPDGRRPFWREVLLAMGLAGLLAGVVLAPTVHFWPNFTKETVDSGFGFSQPLEYIPLNLVIRDYTFYISGGSLGRQPYTDLQFIGWAPVLLALVSLRYIRRPNAGPLLFLAGGAFLSMFVGSGIPLRWLAKWLPVLLGLRFTSPMPGLAVPPILALAAFGLDRLLRLKLPKLEFALVGLGRQAAARFQVQWLLAPVLLVALAQVFGFARSFIHTRDMQPVYTAMAALRPNQAEWVTPPWGEVDWIEPALANGLKVTNIIFSGSLWNGRDLPPAYVQVLREAPPPEAVATGSLMDIPAYTFPANAYAYVQLPDGSTTPCVGQALGGDTTVKCAAAQAGELVVREYTFSGWQARRDNEPGGLALHSGAWLAVDAPAGEHVWLGAGLSLLGVVGLGLLARAGRGEAKTGAGEARPA